MMRSDARTAASLIGAQLSLSLLLLQVLRSTLGRMALVCGGSLLISAAALAMEQGVCVNFKKYPGNAGQYVDELQRLGFHSFRTAISWQYVEKQRGVYAIPADLEDVARMYDEAPSRGVRPIFILGYGNRLYDPSGLVTTSEAREAFARYAGWVAHRFKGKIKYYEVWNEWFVGAKTFGTHGQIGTIDDYVAMLKEVYAAVKKEDPDAVVIGGGADLHSDWMLRFAKAGGLAFVDGLSVHPYNYTYFNVDQNTPEGSLAALEELHVQLKSTYGKDIALYITEIGWPTSSQRYDESVQAAFFSRFFLLARATDYIKGVWWYELEDSGKSPENNEHNFGMTEFGGKPKPAFDAAKSTLSILNSGQDFKARRTGDVVEYLVTGPGETRVSYAWKGYGTPPRAFLKTCSSCAFDIGAEGGAKIGNNGVPARGSALSIWPTEDARH